MRLIRHIDEVPAGLKGGVVALGNFDGLHLGHQAVIGRALELAREAGVAAAVMTFEPHPRAFFQPGQPAFRLSPLRIKARLIEAMGLDYLYVQTFDKDFSQRSADNFVDEVLIDRLAASHVVVGYDYVFGHKRQGDVAFLESKAAVSGFKVSAVDEFKGEGATRFSSTSIREDLAAGRCLEAAELLGRYWEIEGRVEHGDQRGRFLGFPTANLPLGDYLHPLTGVYAVRAGLDAGGETVWYDGVANFGYRPTFDKTDVLLEAHLFDFEGDLYQRHLRVALVEFLRPEEKFSGLDALKAQLAKDCEAARAVLAARAFPPNPQPFVPVG